MYKMTKHLTLLFLFVLFGATMSAQTPAVQYIQPRLAVDCDLEVDLLETIPHCEGWEICIEVTGATLPLTITLNGEPQIDPSVEASLCFSELNPGNYTIEVTDANGCTGTATAMLPAIDYYLEATVHQGSCNTNVGGSIDLHIPIDIAPIFYNWEGPNGFTADTEDIENLAPGNYCVSVTNIDDVCIGRGCWDITGEATIERTLTVNQPSCDDNSAGSICFAISEGTPPYFTFIANSPLTVGIVGTEGCFDNLTPGTYIVTTRDGNDCTFSETITISASSGLEAEFEITSSSCEDGVDGCLYVSGGVPPYHLYVWYDPAPGDVDVEVLFDADGVPYVPNAEPAADFVFGPNTSVNSPFCAQNIPPGHYLVIVVDANGCYTVLPVHIPDSNSLEVTFEITSEACADQVDGCLYIDGGNPPYNLWVWHWNTPSNVLPDVTFNADGEPEIDGAIPTDDIDFQNTAADPFVRCAEDIPPGRYLVLVVDSDGCYRLIHINIPEPGTLALNVESRNVSCNGANDGAIKVQAINGVPPYTFALGTVVMTSDDGTALFEGLAAGTYTINVYDANQCTATVTVVIEESEGLMSNLDFDQYGEFACVEPTGGTPPYAIRWFNLANNAAIGNGNCVYNLPEGAYLVQIRDAHGCVTEDIFFIDPIQCAGGVALVDPDQIQSGGTTTFTLVDWGGINIQWQFKTDYTPWLNIPGATNEVYPTPPLHSASDKTVLVRARVICQGEVLFSEVAELFIEGDNTLLVGNPETMDRYLFQPLAHQALLSEAEANEALVYPTVCQDNFNIQFGAETGTTTIELYNNLGARILQQTLNVNAGAVEQVFVTNFPAGTYIVKIHNQNQVTTQRIVVARN